MTVAAEEILQETYPLLRTGQAPGCPRITPRPRISAAGDRKTGIFSGPASQRDL